MPPEHHEAGQDIWIKENEKEKVGLVEGLQRGGNNMMKRNKVKEKDMMKKNMGTKGVKGRQCT